MVTKSTKSSVSHGKSCGTLCSDKATKKKKPSPKKPKQPLKKYLVGYSIWDGCRHRVGASCGMCYACSEAEAKKHVKSDAQSAERGSKVKIDYVVEI